jgi:hypothetical protein
MVTPIANGTLDWDEVRELVVDAYRQVAPQKLVDRLDAGR